MKRFVVGLVAAAGLVAMAHTVMAQSKTVRSEMRTETGTIEAIEASSRTLTLKKPDGTFVTTVAGPDITRFAELKLGDTVNVRYYENVIVRVKRPGEPDVVSSAKGTTGSDQVLPGGTRAKQVTITATITAIDPNTPTITFTGPNGWKYTSRVQDKAVLANVKAGDRVDVVWTEAMLLSIEAGK
jgi:Cu/Ag efflux protein CusF